MKEPAHVAYDAYCQQMKTDPRERPPAWGELSELRKEAWRAAVAAVT